MPQLKNDVRTALMNNLRDRIDDIADKEKDFWTKARLRTFVNALAGRVMIHMPDIPEEVDDRDVQIAHLVEQARDIMAATIVSLATRISPESFTEVPDATADPM